MKTLALAFLFVFAMSSMSVAGLREPIEIIQEDGQFVFTDGASFYLFKKDGAFQSAPLGLSGRVITGRWKFQLPSRFMIEGQWTWVNGLSARDDFRKMTLVLSATESFEEKQQVSAVELIGPVKIYKCYFTVDEVVKMSPPNRIKE
ncbi:MAG: hypothetical protein ACR2IB_03500 [Pyrinomonadaceae bacterium]